MDRTDYLEHFRSLLSLMRFQAKLPGKDVDRDLYWSCTHRLHDSVCRAHDLGLISWDELQEIQQLRDEIQDQYEVSSREVYPASTVPSFYTEAFRSAEKDAQGYPLKPVLLRDLLEQNLFKELPAIGQESTGAANNISTLAG